jgi:hypothetical protein
MGPPGVGKSTVRLVSNKAVYLLIILFGLQFVNALCGPDAAEVGHGLDACTTVLKPITVEPRDGPFKGRRVVIVDTPPFNHTILPDSEILRRIAVWLALS